MGQESTALPFPVSFACRVEAQGHRLSSPIHTAAGSGPEAGGLRPAGAVSPVMLWGGASPYPRMEAGDQLRELPSLLNSSFGDTDCVWGDDQGSDPSNSQCWCRYCCCKTMPWEGLVAPCRGRL